MGSPRRYYALLSGTYERLARAELSAILEAESVDARILAYMEGAAVLESDTPLPADRIVGRAAYVKEVGLLLGMTEAETGAVLDLLGTLACDLKAVGERFRVELTRYKGYARDSLPQTHLGRVVEALKNRGVPLSPRASSILRIHATEGLALVGIPLSRLDTKPFHSRRPRARPFFKPGPLDPQLSRAFVNLSRLKRGSDVYLDPFCGTGGFVVEACLIGPRMCLCADIDPIMTWGAKRNLSHYGLEDVLVMHADAAMIPLADGTVDSIATDPPYGRSTTLARRGREELYSGFLGEAARILAKGGWLVYAAPVESNPLDLALESGFEVVDYIETYVHSSLTRGIVVARKR